MTTPGQGDILRGMQLEALPLRLARALAPELAPAAAPAATGDAAARERIEQAQREAREEGFRAGYEEGLRRGLADAQTRARAALEQAQAQALAPLEEERKHLASLLAAVEQARAGVLAIAEEDAVALCYELVCRMVGSAAPAPESLRAHWQDLCAGQGGDGGAVLHVHPQDAAALASCVAGVPQGARRLRWVADPQVALGGCVAHGAAGGLDARLETLLASCKDVLLAARAARAGGTP